MSWQDDHPETSVFEGLGADLRNAPLHEVSEFELESNGPQRRRRSSVSSTASTVHAFDFNSPSSRVTSRAGFVSPISEEDTSTSQMLNHAKHDSMYHGLVARATEDTTLAVIPAEAFRRLTKKYPKATGHIVQGTFHVLMHTIHFDNHISSHPDSLFTRDLQCCTQVPRTYNRSFKNGKGYKRYCMPSFTAFFL